MQKLIKAIVLALLLGLSTVHAANTPGLTDDEIVLGQTVYLTGALAELGKDFTAGADAYFRQVNASGGIAGRRVRVVTMDDAYDPKRAVANVDELERQGNGIFCLFQAGGTGSVRALSEVAVNRRIPLVAAIATGPRLRAEHNPYTFYVRAGNVEELQAIVDHLDAIGIRRLAAVYTTTPYGEEGYEALKASVEAKGWELTGVATMQNNGDGSDAAARKLAATAPQAIVMITVPASSKAFIKSARGAGLHATLYSLNAGLPLGAMNELGEDAHGVIVTQIMPNADRPVVPIVREYQQAYLAAGHKTFTSASLEGYINAKVLSEALGRLGRTPTRDGLVRSLESISMDLGGYKVAFGKSKHAGSSTVDLAMGTANGKKFLY